MQFCQLPGTILRAPSESACVVGDGASNDARASKKNDATDDDDDEISADTARTCEGLVDCVIRAQDEPTWQAERDEGEDF
jgi:hypothetical protein